MGGRLGYGVWGVGRGVSGPSSVVILRAARSAEPEDPAARESAKLPGARMLNDFAFGATGSSGRPCGAP